MPYIGKQPLTGAYQLCDTITTSATATYNLLVGGSAVIPGSAQNCIVSLNGVIQAPVSAFTVSGSQITFASALTSTDVIDFILILGNVFDIGTPTNGSVTNSSLNSNVITGQTAVTVPATDDVLLCYDTSATALRKITFANFGNTPAFFAYLNESTDQSISDATFTKAQINTELFDTNNCYDPVTNYRFTPNVAGKYLITYGLTFNPFAADDVNVTLLGIYKNGSLWIQPSNDFRNNPVSSNTITGSQIIDFNGTTDYIELYGYLDEVTGGGAKLNGYKLSCYYGGYRIAGI